VARRGGHGRQAREAKPKFQAVAGTWKDLNRQRELHGQQPHRPGCATSPRLRQAAVARGDLSRKITFDVKGEILELKDTIKHHGGPNFAPLLLKSPAWPVQVGTDGRLGGQAQVPRA